MRLSEEEKNWKRRERIAKRNGMNPEDVLFSDYKQCLYCLDFKHISNFADKVGSKDGLQYHCKNCKKVYACYHMFLYRHKTPEKLQVALRRSQTTTRRIKRLLRGMSIREATEDEVRKEVAISARHNKD